MRLYQSLSFPDLPFVQAEILSQGDHGLKPELGLPISAGDVNVHTRLFAREEVKPEGAVTEYGRAHKRMLLVPARGRRSHNY